MSHTARAVDFSDDEADDNAELAMAKVSLAASRLELTNLQEELTTYTEGLVASVEEEAAISGAKTTVELERRSRLQGQLEETLKQVGIERAANANLASTIRVAEEALQEDRRAAAAATFAYASMRDSLGQAAVSSGEWAKRRHRERAKETTAELARLQSLATRIQAWTKDNLDLSRKASGDHDELELMADCIVAVDDVLEEDKRLLDDHTTADPQDNDTELAAFQRDADTLLKAYADQQVGQEENRN